ncbi:unnamed protein product [Protopolystoma xenopodis]|uniref:Uncharacterized protein n=1 Tax=Protopolystoma xenopodis TaxID=117903 RepID=A0A448WPV3_9PLAT|nr:unnamed protein product [Protopolystoma xenopodis]
MQVFKENDLSRLSDLATLMTRAGTQHNIRPESLHKGILFSRIPSLSDSSLGGFPAEEDDGVNNHSDYENEYDKAELKKALPIISVSPTSSSNEDETTAVGRTSKNSSTSQRECEMSDEANVFQRDLEATGTNKSILKKPGWRNERQRRQASPSSFSTAPALSTVERRSRSAGGRRVGVLRGESSGESDIDDIDDTAETDRTTGWKPSNSRQASRLILDEDRPRVVFACEDAEKIAEDGVPYGAEQAVSLYQYTQRDRRGRDISVDKGEVS